MIWLLVSITLAGNVSMQPFAVQGECEQVRKWILSRSGENKLSAVKSSVCVQIQNPYLKLPRKEVH